MGYLPDPWKHARTVEIEKAGKERGSLKGWRPLGLTTVISKVLERIISSRLLAWLEERNLLPLCQTSYRTAHSTTDHLVRVSECVSMGFSRRESTIAAFLDIEGAFDSVWHDGLRVKLSKLGIPVVLLRWLSNFLTYRTLNVHVGNAASRLIGMRAGVPQGSPLSPVLFLIYTSDIPEDLRCLLSLFADDLAVLAADKNVKRANIRVNNYLVRLARWCRKWRLKLNAAKCKVLVFTRKRKSPDVSVKLNGQQLEQPDCVRFLGLVLDDKLRWSAHVEDICERAIKRLQDIKALTTLGRGLEPALVVRVYNAYVRSVLSYGCAAWLNASDARIQRLQVIQNKALRFALRAPMWTRTDVMHVVCDQPGLRQYLTRTAVDYWRAAKNCNPLMSVTYDRHMSGTGWVVLPLNTPWSQVANLVPPGPWNRPDITRERSRPVEAEQSIARAITGDLNWQ